MKKNIILILRETLFIHVKDKCMEAHSTYYQPGSRESCRRSDDEGISDVNCLAIPSGIRITERGKGSREDFSVGCKESFTAWEDCREEAMKSKEDIVTVCGSLFNGDQVYGCSLSLLSSISCG